MPLPKGYDFEVREKKVYPPLPEDMYQVELLDIEIETIPDKNKPGETQDVLKFQFVVLDDHEFEVDGKKMKVRGRSIWRNFVPTYIWEKNNDKNALYQITKAIIMRDLTPDEMLKFNSDFINKLIGYQCRVVTINKAGTGQNADKTYTNISSFLPKKETMTGLTAEEKEAAHVKEKEKGTTEKDMPSPTHQEEDEPEPIDIEEIKF